MREPVEITTLAEEVRGAVAQALGTKRLRARQAKLEERGYTIDIVYQAGVLWLPPMKPHALVRSCRKDRRLSKHPTKADRAWAAEQGIRL